MSRPWLLAIAIAGVMIATATPARADDTVTCEVVEIAASHGDEAKIDPDLKDLEKSLKKGPFASYNVFAKSARIKRKHTVLKAETYDTPKGKATVIVRDIDRGKKRARITYGINLDDDAGKRYTDAKVSEVAGKFLLFARSLGDKGGIITAVSCK